MLVLLGGTGFIGRHICEIADRANMATTVIVRSKSTKLSQEYPNINFVKSGSLEEVEVMKKAQNVIYLANSSRPATRTDSLTHEIDVNASNLIRFSERLFSCNPESHLVYLSSGGQIYGPKHKIPIDETNDLNPVTPYAFGKVIIEETLKFLEAQLGANVTILRLSNPVGRWQLNTSHGLLTAVINAAVNKLELTIFGKGLNQRDYFDVDDFAQFIVAKHLSGFIPGIYNIGSGHGRNENQVLDLVEYVLDCSISRVYVPARSFDLPYAVLNVSKAKDVLGWNPKTKIEESILKIAKHV